MKPTVSIVVPVYNEIGRLIDGFGQMISYLEKAPYSWELILVDDGSQMSPETVLMGSLHKKKLVNFKRRQQLFFLSLSANQGKGKAIVAGVSFARGKEIIFADIDCSVPIRFLQNIHLALLHAEVAIASRRTNGSVIIVHQTPIREFSGRMYTAIANTVCGLSISDLTCGFKGFRADVAKRIFSSMNIFRWSFDAEVLFLVKKYNYSLIEVPVDWSNKTGSRVKVKDTISTFLDLFRIRLYDAQNKYK